MGKLLKVDIKKNWEGQKNLIVVDVSAVCRSNYVPLTTNGEQVFFNSYRNSGRKLSYTVNGSDFNTSSMYGLFLLFKQYGIDNDYIFCFDTPNNLLKKINENYKKNRVSMGDDYFDQVNTAYKILDESGYRVMAQEGYEADHCVYEAVYVNYDNYDNIAVISNDKDLSALVDEKVVWVDTLKKRTDITMENYTEVLKCPYNSILLKKSLVGDTSDNIKGVKGFGEVAFQKFVINENLEGKDILFNEEEIIKNSTTLTEEKKKEALESLQLVLPYEVSVNGEVKPYSNVNKRIFKAYLRKYGMQSIINLFN